MKKLICFLVVLLALTFPGFAFSSMGSASFKIPSSVISGGGAPMGSASYTSMGTLGQSSPVMEIASSSFTLASGFWYTLLEPELIWDFEPDGDVDGVDLKMFIDGYNPAGSGFNETDLEDFSGEFGTSQ